jgi:hypothetical protein
MAEVTPLNCEGQFKPFVYLNWRTGLPLRSAQEAGKEKSRLSAGLSCSRLVYLRTSDALAIFGRILTLTARILLLLAGLLTAALLAGLLVRVLVLLARIWVLVRHRRSPLLNVVRDNRKARHWFQGALGSAVIIAW